VTRVREQQSYPDHPERFDYWGQVLCRESLTGRCYWEVEWEGGVGIGVTYREITRRGDGDDSGLGGNNKSWSLMCYDAAVAAFAAVPSAADDDDDDDDAAACEGLYIAAYNGSGTVLGLRPSGSNRVGVYVDRPAGTLSFYRVSPHGGSSDTLTHLHTFQLTSTQEDLLPGFVFGRYGSSVTL